MVNKIQKPDVKGEPTDICDTKFLALKEAKYVDKTGKESKWNYVSRKKTTGVVTVIPFDERKARLLFIKQARVPVRKIVISFPAGLIDGNEDPEQTAARELEEETGYRIKRIISKSPLLPKSAGLTDESTYQIQCIVDERNVGRQKLERSENIEFFWASPLEFLEIVRNMDLNEFAVENDTWSFVSGILKGKETC